MYKLFLNRVSQVRILPGAPHLSSANTSREISDLAGVTRIEPLLTPRIAAAPDNIQTSGALPNPSHMVVNWVR